jgi:hypothetical protein
MSNDDGKTGFSNSAGCGCLLMFLAAAFFYSKLEALGDFGLILSLVLGVIVIVLCALGDKFLRWLMK